MRCNFSWWKRTRLRPYTISMPKPLVPIGDYPIMEIVVRQLAYYGFRRIIITVNHQADIIKAYFGNGSKWGVDIIYSLEDKPLGTMGPLKLIPDLPDNFLVINGDILTDLDFGEFISNHEKEGYIFTISAYNRKHRVDYGVLQYNNEFLLTGFEEKPLLDYTVSMGVYSVSKKVLKHIPQNEYYGFDQLMLDLVRSNQKVKVAIFDGYWLDIGRPNDYEKAVDDFNRMKGTLLK